MYYDFLILLFILVSLVYLLKSYLSVIMQAVEINNVKYGEI